MKKSSVHDQSIYFQNQATLFVNFSNKISLNVIACIDWAVSCPPLKSLK